MSSEHLSDDLCLDYLTGELPVEERSSFEAHLEDCSQCRENIEEYRTILRSGLPAIAGEVVDDLTAGSVPWSIEDGEKALYTAIETEAETSSPFGGVEDQAKLTPRKISVAQLANFLLPSNLQTQLAIGACLILALALGISIYRIGLKRGREQSHAVMQVQSNDAAWRAQLENLAHERDQVEASLRERETVISGLRAQLKEQRKHEALEASLRFTSQEAQDQAQRISVQRDELARKLGEQQAAFATAQARVDALQQEGRNDALRVVNLENQIQQMSQVFKDKDGRIDEQQRMLAADRDIRDLIAARDLYIAEVYDVGGNGKRKKPYGRVFYTKGKSLIFYAYDLDQQPGLKNANAFQAWGLRGPDRSNALNLGVMYVDNSTNKRWVLRFDDPKALEEINAVFVTVEPNGGSRAPRGQQVLFAYLKEEPNHP